MSPSHYRWPCLSLPNRDPAYREQLLAARPTILVIDDDVHVRRSIFDVLTRSGHRVLEAPTGKIGSRLAATERPAVIVLDLSLPDMPGIDVCREIRSSNRAPIIVLSGQHGEEHKVTLL